MRASHSWDNNPHHSHSPCEGPTQRASIWIHASRVEPSHWNEGRSAKDTLSVRIFHQNAMCHCVPTSYAVLTFQEPCESHERWWGDISVKTGMEGVSSVLKLFFRKLSFLGGSPMQKGVLSTCSWAVSAPFRTMTASFKTIYRLL